MTLGQFLTEVKGKESDIISYSGDEALREVKRDGYALQFVKVQTPEICLAAVKQTGNALRYIKEQTPEICSEAVKQNGYALQFVKVQTPEICLAAVKQTGNALKYVDKSIFNKEAKKLTVAEISSLLGYDVEIVK